MKCVELEWSSDFHSALLLDGRCGTTSLSLFFLNRLVDSWQMIQDFPSFSHFVYCSRWLLLTGCFFCCCCIRRAGTICISVCACTRFVGMFLWRRALGHDIKPTFLRGLPLHCSRTINTRARTLQMSSNMLNVAWWHIYMLGRGRELSHIIHWIYYVIWRKPWRR